MKPKRTILCVDDNEQALSHRKIMLETRGYRVATFSRGEEALTRFMQGVLFGVAPLDAVSFVAAPAVLALVAAAACLVPARRAAAINPADALRSE